MKRKSKKYAIVITVLVLIGLAMLAVLWTARHELQRSWERSALPSPMAYEQTDIATPTQQLEAPTTAPTQAPAKVALPAEVNLAVPFTSQAPFAKWDLPYKEFCEEASVLMAISYLKGESIPSPEVADQKMLAIKTFEEERFGYYEDTTIAETATIMREFYKYDQVAIKENPTVQNIKQALADGKVVIVPAAGRELGNPYFQTPGPLYHMFVIKGYTADDKFIVNDPGTRHGADFLYDESIIMNAMHDWRSDQNIDLGRKAILIAG